MSAWTCSLGWFRFTVSDSNADEVIARVGGDWIKDNKGFLGYRQGWLSRGGCGGLGRIGTAASLASRSKAGSGWVSRISYERSAPRRSMQGYPATTETR